MKVSVIGIDLGKNSCSLAGMDETGRLVFRKRASRSGLVETVGKHPGCMVAMEACCGAHHLGRVFAELGHEVRLMSPEYVQPYVKAQKNDDRDAEAIAEAATRPTMRFVPVKTQARSDLQSLHRARARDRSVQASAMRLPPPDWSRQDQTRNAGRPTPVDWKPPSEAMVWPVT